MVAAVKGSPRMVDVIARAVRSRQRVPDSDRRLEVGGTTVVMTPAMVASARDRARSSRRPHPCCFRPRTISPHADNRIFGNLKLPSTHDKKMSLTQDVTLLGDTVHVRRRYLYGTVRIRFENTQN